MENGFLNIIIVSNTNHLKNLMILIDAQLRKIIAYMIKKAISALPMKLREKLQSNMKKGEKKVRDILFPT